MLSDSPLYGWYAIFPFLFRRAGAAFLRKESEMKKIASALLGRFWVLAGQFLESLCGRVPVQDEMGAHRYLRNTGVISIEMGRARLVYMGNGSWLYMRHYKTTR
jgi:hypothetical protein